MVWHGGPQTPAPGDLVTGAAATASPLIESLTTPVTAPKCRGTAWMSGTTVGAPTLTLIGVDEGQNVARGTVTTRFPLSEAVVAVPTGTGKLKVPSAAVVPAQSPETRAAQFDIVTARPAIP